MKNAVIFLFFFALAGCSKNNSDLSSDICDQKLAVDLDLFNTAPDDPFTFNSVALDGNCLNISFSYGGGCNDVDIKLIDANTESPSTIPIRTLRLSLDDNDDCEAWITKEISFDLTPLHQGDSGELILDIRGWDTPVNYKF